MERVTEGTPGAKRIEDVSRGLAWFLGILGILCIAVVVIFKIGWPILIGLMSLAAAFLLAGVYIVQSPDRAMIERFGEFVRKTRPGLRWKIPIIETVRKALSLWEQPVAILSEAGVTVDFKDGTAKPVAAFVYYRIQEENTEAAVYGVRDIRAWVRDNISPLIRGFHNGFFVNEALDEASVRGNLLERINEAPDITKEKIQGVDLQIVAYQGKGKDSTTLVEQLGRRKTELQASLVIFEKIKAELGKFLADAGDKGVRILRAVVGEYELSQATVAARERVIQERREAEAARYTAEKEATLRAGPILAVKKALVDGGVSSEVAEQAAINFEILDSFKAMGLKLDIVQIASGHPAAGVLASVYPSLFGGLGGVGGKEVK